MKNSKLVFVLFALLSLVIFVSCDSDPDTQAPNIYFLDSEGNTVTDNDANETVLLFSKYSDAGIYADDNVSDSENIVIDSDIIEELSTNTYGQVTKTGLYTITYSAIDEAQNIALKTKEITVENISIPFIGTYSTERTNSEIGDTIYNSTISADTRVSGRLRFPKVYARNFGEVKTYYGVVADLFSLDQSLSFSDNLGYTGIVSDSESAFFKDLVYDEALDSIMSFDLLKIQAQEFTDDLGNEVLIVGIEQDNIPLSRIEYVAGSKTISRIVLELNVTFNGAAGAPVIEVYTPL